MNDAVQRDWARLAVRQRMRIFARARVAIALNPECFFEAGRHEARKASVDTLTTEVLPLLAAMRFLERSAESILKPRRLGRRGLPLWLSGIRSEVHRVPFGTVLVIGPSNYPLLLPGLQTLQALAAGNRVIWKPGIGGSEVARALAKLLADAGLPDGLLEITDETVAAAEQAIDAGVDKVFLTGSVPSGRALLHRLADRIVPSVVELSGCDACIVLPGADVSRVVHAMTFGMRLNGSATCMAPRRVLLVGASNAQREELVARLIAAFKMVDPVALPAATRERLQSLLQEAKLAGATVHGTFAGDRNTTPLLVVGGNADLLIAKEDIFAPVLTLLEVRSAEGVVATHRACPFGLTASLFGPKAECRKLAEELEVGTIFINDVIVPSADPRLPFGGRRLSGFGVTQGVEGLLEMTAVKTVAVRRSTSVRHFEPTTARHIGLFAGVVQAAYAGRIANRLRGVVKTVKAGREFR